MVVRRNRRGLFQCPCGDPAHARRRSDRLVSLCHRSNHPAPGEVGGSLDTSDERDQRSGSEGGDVDDSDSHERRAVTIPRRRRHGAGDALSAASPTGSRAHDAAGTVTGIISAPTLRHGRPRLPRRRSSSPVRGIREELKDEEEESDEELLTLRATLTKLRKAEKRKLRRSIARYSTG